MMTNIDQMFELAIELRDSGDLRDAVGVLSRIVDTYSEDRGIAGVHTVLGGVYSDLNEHEKALENFKKATILNEKSELASLGLYIAYVKLDKDEEAIREMKRYLKSFPADLYKGTLEELLEGLQDGYMTDYKNEIEELAKINGVALS
jgi:tetratricopeptide (TPR) repeat protein